MLLHLATGAACGRCCMAHPLCRPDLLWALTTDRRQRRRRLSMTAVPTSAMPPAPLQLRRRRHSRARGTAAGMALAHRRCEFDPTTSASGSDSIMMTSAWCRHVGGGGAPNAAMAGVCGAVAGQWRQAKKLVSAASGGPSSAGERIGHGQRARHHRRRRHRHQRGVMRQRRRRARRRNRPRQHARLVGP